MTLETSPTKPTIFQEADMGELANFVPDLLAEKDWDTKTFVARCMLAGMGQDTAYRLARGETNFTTETLKVAADVLGQESIGRLIDIRNSKDGE